MLFVGTSIIHPSTEGVFLLCNILDLLIYSIDFKNWFESVFKKYSNRSTIAKVSLQEEFSGFLTQERQDKEKI